MLFEILFRSDYGFIRPNRLRNLINYHNYRLPPSLNSYRRCLCCFGISGIEDPPRTAGCLRKDRCTASETSHIRLVEVLSKKNGSAAWKAANHEQQKPHEHQNQWPEKLYFPTQTYLDPETLEGLFASRSVPGSLLKGVKRPTRRYSLFVPRGFC